MYALYRSGVMFLTMGMNMLKVWLMNNSYTANESKVTDGDVIKL